MSLALTIGCLIACVVLATFLSRPATSRTRERSEARRAAYVAAHPEHARTSDVVAALRREGVSDPTIDDVLRAAREQGTTAVELWQHFDRFGVDSLAPGVDRGPSEDEPSTASHDDVADRPRHRSSLPEVHDPGHYPGLLVPRRGRVHLGDNVRRDGGTNHSAA